MFRSVLSTVPCSLTNSTDRFFFRMYVHIVVKKCSEFRIRFINCQFYHNFAMPTTAKIFRFPCNIAYNGYEYTLYVFCVLCGYTRLMQKNRIGTSTILSYISSYYLSSEVNFIQSNFTSVSHESCKKWMLA